MRPFLLVQSSAVCLSAITAATSRRRDVRTACFTLFLQLKSSHIARLNLPAAYLCYNTIYGVEIVR